MHNRNYEGKSKAILQQQAYLATEVNVRKLIIRDFKKGDGIPRLAVSFVLLCSE
jgi:hypothetical protein